MAYEPTIQMDNDEFYTHDARGHIAAMFQAGVNDFPADFWVIVEKNGEPVIVPVVLVDPVSIWGTLDTNVSPAKLAISAVSRSDGAAYMTDPIEESGVPGIEPVVRVMRGYLTEQDALDALRAELEV